MEAVGYEYNPSDENAENESTALKKILSETDLFIVNTCSVRQKSEDKVYGIGKVLKELSLEKGRKPYVVMAGCMVGSVTGERQRYDFEILRKKTPWVDLYINPSQIYDLPHKLHEKGVLSEWAVQKFDPKNVASKQPQTKQAFVNVSYGCDNFCTFCVVPYARGAEISRSDEEILKEITLLREERPK